ncbi:MAG: hypothetical protein H7Z42_04245 [Roseiflexaceae bacterium]|nr:hypothetical protein [Roseiflexaceae bacterium]
MAKMPAAVVSSTFVQVNYVAYSKNIGRLCEATKLDCIKSIISFCQLFAGPIPRHARSTPMARGHRKGELSERPLLALTANPGAWLALAFPIPTGLDKCLEQFAAIGR